MTDTERLNQLIRWATEPVITSMRRRETQEGVNPGWLRNVIAEGREGIDAEMTQPESEITLCEICRRLNLKVPA